MPTSCDKHRKENGHIMPESTGRRRKGQWPIMLNTGRRRTMASERKEEMATSSDKHPEGKGLSSASKHRKENDQWPLIMQKHQEEEKPMKPNIMLKAWTEGGKANGHISWLLRKEGEGSLEAVWNTLGFGFHLAGLFSSRETMNSKRVPNARTNPFVFWKKIDRSQQVVVSLHGLQSLQPRIIGARYCELLATLIIPILRQLPVTSQQTYKVSWFYCISLILSLASFIL
ncbi:hypothetical protein AVEN_77717-1 [Araneus ventricosus]|uniref:Uncharacterized protein n=1 Tax=Araneus ventricosus TaxID=182803 RepID=A0A4Y2RFD1_ARAVE|nr:hypothetical protein AVEN_77717-1 [Araneus ventricosus]